MALKDTLWGSPFSRLLVPLSWLYRAAGWVRARWVRPQKMQVPVICVGNVVAGGAGKTPIALALAGLLKQTGHHPALVYKGYRRNSQKTLMVDPDFHTLADTGDEPLLAARVAPTFVAQTRLKAALAAQNYGAHVLILDDGMQNPSLMKDLTFLVWDASYGLGNERILPAGPLRMTPKQAINACDALIVLGEGPVPVTPKPIFRARLVPLLPDSLKTQPLMAFAGIGRPEKFFTGLKQAGAHIIKTLSFPDHHAYTPTDLDDIGHQKPDHAILVTTEKDAVRLPPDFAVPIGVQVVWQNEEALRSFLRSRLVF